MALSAEGRSWVQTAILAVGLLLVWVAVRGVHEEVDAKTGWRARADATMRQTAQDLSELLEWKRELQRREGAGEEGATKPWRLPPTR